MKVYYVGTDHWDYDEYDGFVVVTENENKALAMVKHQFSAYQQDTLEVEEIDLTTEQIILSSFNAG